MNNISTHTEMLNKYRDALLAHFPNDLQRLIVFGSYARGDNHSESDIDVLVLVGWEEKRLPNGLYAHPYNDSRWQTIVELAQDVSLEYELILSPFVMSEKRFQQWSPFGNAVKSEGIEIWKKKN